MRTVAIVLALAATVVGVALFARAAAAIVGVVRLGRPLPGRRDQPGDRWRQLLAETLGHTRMLQWTGVGMAHWFVFIAFGALFFTLVTAYGQLFDPRFALPVIGHWVVYEWASEVIAWAGLVGIVGLMLVRASLRGLGRRSRFFGSRTWQGVFVELAILGIVLCVLLCERWSTSCSGAGDAAAGHFPFTWFLLPSGLPAEALATGIVVVVGDQDHHLDGLVRRDRAEHHDGGGLAPVHRLAEHLVQAGGVRAAGARCAAADHGRRQAAGLRRDRGPRRGRRLGVGKVEDFTWKGLLDFTSCTECGRCQSQCPAWNTEKPLSPKLLIMDLREHAYAKAPYLQAAEAAREELPEAVRAEAARPLVGPIQVEGTGWPG